MKGSTRKVGNKWQYVVDMGRDVGGKRIQKRKAGFKTKREAEQALAKMITELNAGTYIEPAKTLFKQYLTDWLDAKEHSFSSQTVSLYRSYFSNHIWPVLGNVAISKLTVTHLQGFIVELRNKGLSDTTIKRVYDVVNAALATAEKQQVIPKNVASLVDKPKIKRKEMQIWSKENVHRFLEAAKQSRYYIAFLLALTTGMRQGEILGLPWKNVDLDTGLLSVSQTLSHDGKQIVSGAKTNSSIRTIALPRFVVSELQRHKIQTAKDRLMLGGGYEDCGLVVRSSKGTMGNSSNLRREFIQLIEKAGVPSIRFHDMRHTHASLLLQENINPKVISERLGHSKIQTTLDVYSHVMPNMQREAAQKFEDAIFGAM